MKNLNKLTAAAVAMLGVLVTTAAFAGHDATGENTFQPIEKVWVPVVGFHAEGSGPDVVAYLRGNPDLDGTAGKINHYMTVGSMVTTCPGQPQLSIKQTDAYFMVNSDGSGQYYPYAARVYENDKIYLVRFDSTTAVCLGELSQLEFSQQLATQASMIADRLKDFVAASDLIESKIATDPSQISLANLHLARLNLRGPLATLVLDLGGTDFGWMQTDVEFADSFAPMRALDWNKVSSIEALANTGLMPGVDDADIQFLETHTDIRTIIGLTKELDPYVAGESQWDPLKAQIEADPAWNLAKELTNNGTITCTYRDGCARDYQILTYVTDEILVEDLSHAISQLPAHTTPTVRPRN